MVSGAWEVVVVSGEDDVASLTVSEEVAVVSVAVSVTSEFAGEIVSVVEYSFLVPSKFVDCATFYHWRQYLIKYLIRKKLGHFNNVFAYYPTYQAL